MNKARTVKFKNGSLEVMITLLNNDGTIKIYDNIIRIEQRDMNEEEKTFFEELFAINKQVDSNDTIVSIAAILLYRFGPNVWGYWDSVFFDSDNGFDLSLNGQNLVGKLDDSLLVSLFILSRPLNKVSTYEEFLSTLKKCIISID